MSNKSSKRIAFFSRYLQPGGVEEVTVTLANRLSERGYRVDILLAKGKGQLAKNVSREVDLVDFSRRRVWKCVFDLKKYIDTSRPDSVLSMQDRTSAVLIAASLMSSQNPNKVVVDQINLLEYIKGLDKVYGIGVRALVKIFYPFADVVVGVSHGVIEDTKRLVGLPESKTRVIHNPVVSEKLYKDARVDPENPWLHSDTVKVILGVGRLHPQKNFPLLVRAFGKAYEENQNLRLIILGEGSHRSEIESTITRLGLSDVVRLPGFVSNPYSYMARADLFALSSNYEGFGIVVAEALACGCPVVSTDCPSGPREILEDGKWGTLVPVGDEKALSDAMKESLDQEHDRQAYRERGAMFSVEHSVDDYERVLFPE